MGAIDDRWHGKRLHSISAVLGFIVGVHRAPRKRQIDKCFFPDLNACSIREK